MSYVYRHIRHDTNHVFYVGIGSDNTYRRARNKDVRSDIWKRTAAKTEYTVEIMIDGVSREEALEKEKEFIALYGRRNTGTGTLVNLTDGGKDNKGFVVSDEVRENMRKASRNRNLTPELRKVFSDAGKNKIISDEARIKLSLAHKGRPKSEEHRKNLSIAKTGLKPSEETRAKLRAAKANRVYTPETCANISNALKGKSHSQEHRMNNFLSNARLTKDQVDEIKKLCADGVDGVTIGKMFGTSKSVVHNIKIGKSYSKYYTI